MKYNKTTSSKGLRPSMESSKQLTDFDTISKAKTKRTKAYKKLF